MTVLIIVTLVLAGLASVLTLIDMSELDNNKENWNDERTNDL